MAYFPFFVNIGGKPSLIAGGGVVALRKIEKLLPFGPELKVIAPHISEEIKKIPGLQLEEREYRAGDEEGCLFVIAATDSREVNREISENCQARGIAVNAVDDAELCSFIFPALVQRGELTVGISTSGASPTAAIYLKDEIQRLLPESFDEILDYLHRERDIIKKSVPDEHERHLILKKLLLASMEKGAVPTGEEAENIINGRAGE